MDISLENEAIRIFSLKESHLSILLRLYNKFEEFKFATGFVEKVDFKDICRIYAEAVNDKHSFFAGICPKDGSRIIGLIKGAVRGAVKKVLWINTLLVDTDFQNKGYGTMSLNLILEYFYNAFGIQDIFVSVIKSNAKGLNFWVNKGFKEIKGLRIIKNFDNLCHNVLIMHKIYYP
ncbi:MAG TPA: N-acetyltransferase [Clostridiaceae bacterium]|nr:N-acetyltransferase [Clostridiaceae bacterium]